MTEFPIEKLTDNSPYRHIIWTGTPPISTADISLALLEDRLRSRQWKLGCRPNEHIERIAYLVRHGWTRPISVIIERYYGNASYYIDDGYHRLAAAIYLGDKTIEAVVL